MASATVAFNAIVVDALTQHNYRDWSSQIETYFLAKDIWDVVKLETPASDNEEAKLSKDWTTKDAKALHAIKVCCGKEAFSFIREIRSAKIAWDNLEKKFNSPSSSSTPVPERKETDKVEEISLDTTTNDADHAGQTHHPEEELAAGEDLEKQGGDGGNENSAIVKSFFGYVKKGDLDQTKELLTKHPQALRARDPENGCTALHLATSYGRRSIVTELLKMMPKGDLALEIKETTNGNTALHIAVQNQNVTLARELLSRMREEGLGLQNSRGETALHIAVIMNVRGSEVLMSGILDSMRNQDLEIKDNEGYTALARHLNHVVIRWPIVDKMIKKNSKLLATETSSYNRIPVVEACAQGRWGLCQYLYYSTIQIDLFSGNITEWMNRSHGSQLLNMCIRHPNGLDIACDLLRRRPRLAFVENELKICPMLVLARLHFAFRSGSRLTFWQKWIYKCMYVGLTDDQKFFSEDDQDFSKMMAWIRIFSEVLRRLINVFLRFLGCNHLYEMKSTHALVLNCMDNVTRNQEPLTLVETNTVTESVFKAIEHGHVEFVICMCEAYPKLVDTNIHRKERDILQHAIECRQEEIYNFIYKLKKKRRYEISNYLEDFQNTLLHSAANFSSLTRSNQDASLQMQRELQWFKEVESIVPLEMHEYLNSSSNGLTARELFTTSHADLKKKAEKSIKGTAGSCTTVGTLIITIMFAVAFTSPGGTDSSTGLPMFMHRKLFRVFIISDTVSLVSSATSVITFLGILTSSYAEDDFVRSLPTKMVIGLSTLFISIAAMMITFSCALNIMLDGEAKMTYPVIALATLPVLSFAYFIFPLLFEICKSTYGPSIFQRKDGGRSLLRLPFRWITSFLGWINSRLARLAPY